MVAVAETAQQRDYADLSVPNDPRNSPVAIAAFLTRSFEMNDLQRGKAAGRALFNCPTELMVLQSLVDQTWASNISVRASGFSRATLCPQSKAKVDHSGSPLRCW